MILKKLLAAAISAVVTSAAFSSTVCFAESNTSTDTDKSAIQDTEAEPAEVIKHTVTFLDFDGNVLKELEVEEGASIDYSSVNTASLNKHLDMNTEQDFSSWDINPEIADKDYTIHALSKTAHIYLKKKPDKTRYFSSKGKVFLDGLQVYIDLSVQTSEKDSKGNYITADSTIDVSASCFAKPSTLSAAFVNGDKATISVYPIADNKPICYFDITRYRDLGDVNLDGTIDSIDASLVLSIYANLASSQSYKVAENTKKLADVDMNGNIDAYDATYILQYYAAASTAKTFMDWDNIIDYDKILN